MSAWHADHALIDAYRLGRTDDALSYSLESHLLACANCRAAVAAGGDVDAIERGWRGIAVELDAPRGGFIERLFVRAGMPDHVARVLAATRSLRASWILAVCVSLAFAVAAARTGDGGVLMFLILAPLLPVAGVAAAYGPGIDPTYEIGRATPMRSFRLLLIRSAAVLSATTALAAVAALFLPRLNWTVVAWVLPSLGLTLSSLALATVVSPIVGAASVACGWVAVTLLVSSAADDHLAAFRASGQALFAVIAVVAGALITVRRETFDGRSRK